MNLTVDHLPEQRISHSADSYSKMEFWADSVVDRITLYCRRKLRPFLIQGIVRRSHSHWSGVR